MLARYREAVETVLRFRDNRDRQIRRAVIGLLPRLATFAPERFAATYLRQCTEYLLLVLKIPSERGAGQDISLWGCQCARLLLSRSAAGLLGAMPMPPCCKTSSASLHCV